MYDISLIKELLKKESYEKYRNYLTEKDFSRELIPVLKALDTFHKGYAQDATVEDLANLTLAQGIPDKDKEYLHTLFSNMHSINGVETVHILLEKFKKNKLSEQIALAAVDAAEGRKSFEDVIALAKQLENPVIEDKIEYVTDDLDDILETTVNKPGLRWRLDSLNKSLGSLRKGDFGFIFARPETGKTTFLACEVTFFSQQLTETSGPILWFNNEEQGKKVKLRCYQAALKATLPRLLTDAKKARELYRERTHDKVKIFDSSAIHRRQIENICAREKPSLIVFDQIDKIKGFSSDREDLIMGAIYQWARELAKEYAPVIGVCQADGTAEGERWLHMANVANAKTAKQAEADFIIGIGKSHEQGYDFVRYINISKNKLSGDSDSDPQMRHAKIEVLIKPDVARYEDIA